MKRESQMIILFGATGDLARRKLIPALYHLEKRGRLTRCTPIVCVGRQKLSTSEYLQLLLPERYISDIEPEPLKELLGRIVYFHFDPTRNSSAEFLAGINEIQQSFACTPNTLIYLALPTAAFQQTAQLIGSLHFENGWKRVVFEKPFGENLASATQLNHDILSILHENEIYRVDHYLGKELVQNILTLRFSNEIFSGAWRSRAIDHIQISVSETLGVEKRAGYYDKSGAVRDMLQNHLLQLLSFVAMEPPVEGERDGLRNAARDVMHKLRPLQQPDIVFGQYGPGKIGAEQVAGYLDEDGVSNASTTETFVAVRAHVDTGRWRGVPFYLRTGKRLQRRSAEIRIVFKVNRRQVTGKTTEPNMIVIRIQPDAGIALAFNVQKPGEIDETESVIMDFCHHCHFGPNTPEAYESILSNIMEGDHSIFPRRDWIEASWKYIDRLRSLALPPVSYSAGSSGPVEADQLLRTDGREWFRDEIEKPVISFPKSNL